MATTNVKAVISAEDRASAVLKRFGINASKMGLALGAVGATIGVSVKQAIDFESAFAGVRKTVEASEEEFAQLRQNFRDIAKETPVTVEELSKIGEMAGQLGVDGVDNLTKFTKTIADISVTTNLTAEEASTSFARIANIMQESLDNVDRMGATVVELGNNFATTESEITNFANRIAGASQIAGLSTADIFGISSAFTSVGVGAERGGTAVSKTLFAMSDAVKGTGKNLGKFAKVAGVSSKEFARLYEEDASKAFNLFVEGIEENGIKATGLLEELELSDQRLVQAFISVAGAGGIMEDAIKTATEAWDENNALTEEAQKRYETVSAQIDIFKNNINDLAITAGDKLLPMLSSTVEWLTENLDSVMLLVGAFITLKGVMMAQAGWVAVNTALATMQTGFASATLATLGWKSLLTKLILPTGALALFAVGAVALIQKVLDKWNETDEAIRRTQERVSANENSNDIARKKMNQKWKAGEITTKQYKAFLNNIDSSSGNFQLGGNVTAGRSFLVGEGGGNPEMFVPSRSGRVEPLGDRGRANTINLNVNIGMYSGTGVEKRKIAKAIMDSLKEIASAQGKTVGELMG